MRGIARAVVAMHCVALLAACGDVSEPGGVGESRAPEATIEAIITPSPTQTSVPIDQNPTPPPGEPRLIEITGHHDQPVTPEMLAGFSSLVVVGVVREHLAARWSTSDGSRPEEILSEPSKTIFTPVVVDLEQPPLMDLDGNSSDATSIIVLIEGGTIDEVTMTHTGSFYDLPIGARVVLGADSISSPGALRIYGEVFDHMLPENYETAWLPELRFILSGGSVASDGERFTEGEFFNRLDAAIEQRETR